LEFQNGHEMGQGGLGLTLKCQWHVGCMCLLELVSIGYKYEMNSRITFEILSWDTRLNSMWIMRNRRKCSPTRNCWAYLAQRKWKISCSAIKVGFHLSKLC